MSDLHIDDFCRDVALILGHLYLGFPRRQLLYVEDLLGPVEVDDFGLPTSRFQACFSAMVWLGEEGWLRFEAPLRQEGVDQVVLTQRAFLLLSSCPSPPVDTADSALPPSVTAAAGTRIARLRRALRQGSSIELGSAVQELLGAGTDRNPGNQH